MKRTVVYLLLMISLTGSIVAGKPGVVRGIITDPEQRAFNQRYSELMQKDTENMLLEDIQQYQQALENLQKDAPRYKITRGASKALDRRISSVGSEITLKQQEIDEASHSVWGESGEGRPVAGVSWEDTEEESGGGTEAESGRSRSRAKTARVSEVAMGSDVAEDIPGMPAGFWDESPRKSTGSLSDSSLSQARPVLPKHPVTSSQGQPQQPVSPVPAQKAPALSEGEYDAQLSFWYEPLNLLEGGALYERLVDKETVKDDFIQLNEEIEKLKQLFKKSTTVFNTISNSTKAINASLTKLHGIFERINTQFAGKQLFTDNNAQYTFKYDESVIENWIQFFTATPLDFASLAKQFTALMDPFFGFSTKTATLVKDRLSSSYTGPTAFKPFMTFALFDDLASKQKKYPFYFDLGLGLISGGYFENDFQASVLNQGFYTVLLTKVKDAANAQYDALNRDAYAGLLGNMVTKLFPVKEDKFKSWYDELHKLSAASDTYLSKIDTEMGKWYKLSGEAKDDEIKKDMQQSLAPLLGAAGQTGTPTNTFGELYVLCIEILPGIPGSTVQKAAINKVKAKLRSMLTYRIDQYNWTVSTKHLEFENVLVAARQSLAARDISVDQIKTVVASVPASSSSTTLPKTSGPQTSPVSVTSKPGEAVVSFWDNPTILQVNGALYDKLTTTDLKTAGQNVVALVTKLKKIFHTFSKPDETTGLTGGVSMSIQSVASVRGDRMGNVKKFLTQHIGAVTQLGVISSSLQETENIKRHFDFDINFLTSLHAFFATDTFDLKTFNTMRLPKEKNIEVSLLDAIATNKKVALKGIFGNLETGKSSLNDIKSNLDQINIDRDFKAFTGNPYPGLLELSFVRLKEIVDERASASTAAPAKPVTPMASSSSSSSASRSLSSSSASSSSASSSFLMNPELLSTDSELGKLSTDEGVAAELKKLHAAVVQLKKDFTNDIGGRFGVSLSGAEGRRDTVLKALNEALGAIDTLETKGVALQKFADDTELLRFWHGLFAKKLYDGGTLDQVSALFASKHFGISSQPVETVLERSVQEKFKPLFGELKQFVSRYTKDKQFPFYGRLVSDNTAKNDLFGALQGSDQKGFYALITGYIQGSGEKHFNNAFSWPIVESKYTRLSELGFEGTNKADQLKTALVKADHISPLVRDVFGPIYNNILGKRAELATPKNELRVLMGWILGIGDVAQGEKEALKKKYNLDKSIDVKQPIFKDFYNNLAAIKEAPSNFGIDAQSQGKLNTLLAELQREAEFYLDAYNWSVGYAQDKTKTLESLNFLK